MLCITTLSTLTKNFTHPRELRCLGQVCNINESATLKGCKLSRLKCDFFVQELFRTVKYELVGDGKAARFFEVEETTGRVTISSPLSGDTGLVYTVSGIMPQTFCRLHTDWDISSESVSSRLLSWVDCVE